MMSDTREILLDQLDRLHTTPLGTERIRRNLCLDTEDVVAWCRELIALPDAEFCRDGKNWYITADNVVLTVHANALTVITAHKINT